MRYAFCIVANANQIDGGNVRISTQTVVGVIEAVSEVEAVGKLTRVSAKILPRSKGWTYVGTPSVWPADQNPFDVDGDFKVLEPIYA